MQARTHTICSEVRCQRPEADAPPRDMRPFMARLGQVRSLMQCEPDPGAAQNVALRAAIQEAQQLLDDARDFARDPAAYVRPAAIRLAAARRAGQPEDPRPPCSRLACSLEIQAQVAQGVHGFRPRVLEALTSATLQVRWVGLDLDERMEFLADLAAQYGRFRQWAAAELDLDGPARLALELLTMDPPQSLDARLLLSTVPRAGELRRARERRQVRFPCARALELLEQSPAVRCLRRTVRAGQGGAGRAGALVDEVVQGLALASQLAGDPGWGLLQLDRVYTAVADGDVGWALLPPWISPDVARKGLQLLARDAAARAATCRVPAPWLPEAPPLAPLVVCLGRGAGEMGFLDRASHEPLRLVQGELTAAPRDLLRVLGIEAGPEEEQEEAW